MTFEEPNLEPVDIAASTTVSAASASAAADPSSKVSAHRATAERKVVESGILTLSLRLRQIAPHHYRRYHVPSCLIIKTSLLLFC